MNKWLIGGVVVFVLILFAGFLFSGPIQEEAQAQLTLGFTPEMSEFSRVEGPQGLSFPADLGSHEAYLSEWWYYTGNVFTESGRHFAYQLTFFRRALGNEIQLGESTWATNQVYFAHFSVIDVEADDHRAWEKFSRGGEIGLAGAATEPVFEVWLNDWSVKQQEDAFILTAAADEVVLNLTLDDLKGIVLQGKDGYSQKGEEAGNASIYFSQPRLETEGTIQIGEEVFSVSGLSWMDHEFGTSALGEGQLGWDWFSIQLDNGAELMLYQIREDGDKISPYSAGNLISADGDSTYLTVEAFSLTPTDKWTNPDGVRYPIEWEINIKEPDIQLTVKAVIPDQENRFVYFQYWEGAVQVHGTLQGEPVSGWGFLEMTGYLSSMEGLF